jgi:hypothetical protein
MVTIGNANDALRAVNGDLREIGHGIQRTVYTSDDGKVKATMARIVLSTIAFKRCDDLTWRVGYRLRHCLR